MNNRRIYHIWVLCILLFMTGCGNQTQTDTLPSAPTSSTGAVQEIPKDDSLVDEAELPPIIENSDDTSEATEGIPAVVLSGEQFLDSVESKVLDAVNEERKSRGLPILYFDIELQTGARIRSYELCEAGLFDHTRPDGDGWSSVLTEDLHMGKLGLVGENLARVDSQNPAREHLTAAEWVKMWKDSPEHYALILNESFTHGAVGIYYMRTDDRYVTYATMLFAEQEDS